MEGKLTMNFNLLSNLSTNPVIWIRGMEGLLNSAVENGNSIVLNFQVSDRSFQPYYTMSKIIEQMETVYSGKLPTKMKVVNLAFDNLMNSWKRMDMGSDSIIYSIIRRISRESSATSKLIDQVAEKVVEMVNELFISEGKNIILVINASEWIDRPSLRVLHRIFKLLPSSHLKLGLGFTDDIPSTFELDNPFDMQESIIVARSRIFKRLLLEQSPLIIGKEKNRCDFSDYRYYGTENGLMSDAAIALVTQNYENAFLACEKVKSTQSPSEEIFRIIGLVHANLSLYEASYSAFKEALKYEDSGPKRAHIECLAALLAVKRFYNLEVARSHYESALKFVDESEKVNRLEKGWILNGMSFMNTVASSKLQGEEKNKLLDSVLERELKALQLVKNERDSGSLYLRYNLLSNITFLLEIRKDYQTALEFWKTAFTKLIGDDHGYCYRTGMLSWKAGKIEDGINYLKQAYLTASSQKDRLDSESILYALGYVNFEIGSYEESINNFVEGLKFAITLRDFTKMEEHVKGFLRASSMVGKLEENLIFLKDICTNLDNTLPNKVSEFLEKDITILKQLIFENNLRHPKTKLSSYHPSVDLESVPEIDMNEYLISHSKENLITFK